MILFLIASIENPSKVVSGHISTSIIPPEGGEGKGVIAGKILCADGVTPLEVADPDYISIEPFSAPALTTCSGTDGYYNTEVEPGSYRVNVVVGGIVVGGAEGIEVGAGETKEGVDVVTSRILTYKKQLTFFFIPTNNTKK